MRLGNEREKGGEEGEKEERGRIPVGERVVDGIGRTLGREAEGMVFQ